jgi:S-adenosylmethionine:tRNA-ribosyltransferase-isomerase (queuine synthetase)
MIAAVPFAPPPANEATTTPERRGLARDGVRTVDAAHPRLWYVALALGEDIETFLARHGAPIRYRYVDGTLPLAEYQTVFARRPGSAEMPSAGRPFTARVLAGLLTGFHEPQASHLDLLAAFAGAALLESAYDRAVAAGYLWHEFGDVHLLIRRCDR